ncbi:MAG: hypothetical protein ACLTBU_14965 [Zhenhengia sp.]|uniref:hypothetical protein n=1 Tax=Zhenhengia sp. TaxID=2944208 RepID=UPI003995C6F7
MKRTIVSVVVFLINWNMIYRLSLWICDKFPYGWVDLVGFVLMLIGFAISLVLTKKVTDYLLGAE